MQHHWQGVCLLLTEQTRWAHHCCSLSLSSFLSCLSSSAAGILLIRTIDRLDSFEFRKWEHFTDAGSNSVFSVCGLYHVSYQRLSCHSFFVARYQGLGSETEPAITVNIGSMFSHHWSQLWRFFHFCLWSWHHSISKTLLSRKHLTPRV